MGRFMVLILCVALGLSIVSDIAVGFELKLKSFEDANKHYVLSIDPTGEPEAITAQVNAFIQAHPETRTAEARITEMVNRRMHGIKLKETLDLDGICGNLITDVDSSFLQEFAKMSVEETTSGDGAIIRYAETGSYLGCSSIMMTSLLPPGSIVYAHDLWVDWGSGEILAKEGDPPEMIENYFYHFYENVRSRGLERSIIPVRGNSSYTLGMHEPESLNIGFIDGDHSYNGVLADLRAMHPLMKPGGVLLLHDVMNTGEIINPAGEAVRDFCLEERGRVCDFMIGGTEFARVRI